MEQELCSSEIWNHTWGGGYGVGDREVQGGQHQQEVQLLHQLDQLDPPAATEATAIRYQIRVKTLAV